MDEQREKIWQRGSAREIMREARKRFRETKKTDSLAAHVALASVHYSLVKRYLNAWWRKPLGLWHLARAVRHALYAAHIDTMRTVGEETTLTLDQIDVVTTIWNKSPVWLGTRPYRAQVLLELALGEHPEASSMKPHTRALMLITLGELEFKVDPVAADGHYNAAYDLIPKIEEEESADREYQLIRVQSAVGFFFWDRAEYKKSREVLWQAYAKACQIAKDQALKIESECSKRGFRILLR